MTDVQAVKDFWESKPLFTGESAHAPGTRDYFEEHRRVCVEDCYAGKIPPRMLPQSPVQDALDVGCGPGFWTVEMLRTGKIKNMTSCDLTAAGVDLCKKRLEIYGLTADVVQANAEELPFPDNAFDFVASTGVIHHTPNTEKALAEIARVLRPGGTAVISVYYKNFVLRHWRVFSPLGKLAFAAGARLKGRGRETIYAMPDADQIVCAYDGAENPIGKAYTRQRFVEMMSRHFRVDDVFYHFFPARSLPFAVPKPIHRALEKILPFMIVGRMTKRS